MMARKPRPHPGVQGPKPRCLLSRKLSYGRIRTSRPHPSREAPSWHGRTQPPPGGGVGGAVTGSQPWAGVTGSGGHRVLEPSWLHRPQLRTDLNLLLFYLICSGGCGPPGCPSEHPGPTCSRSPHPPASGSREPRTEPGEAGGWVGGVPGTKETCLGLGHPAVVSLGNCGSLLPRRDSGAVGFEFCRGGSYPGAYWGSAIWPHTKVPVREGPFPPWALSPLSPAPPP